MKTITSTFACLDTHRNYRLYFTGQIVSNTGSQMQDAALPWLLLQRTHSPFLVGVLVFARYGPFTLMGPYGGVIADRFDNRRLQIVSQVGQMGIASLLAVVAFVGSAPVFTIFLLAGATGIALVFDTPSKYALIYQLVAREDLPNAVGLTITLQSVSRIVGPALGGVLIAAFGVGWCFLINAASFVAIFASLLMMRRSEFFPLDRGEEAHLPQLAALREGFDYLRSSREVRTLVGLAIVGGLFGFSAVRTLLPVLAKQTFHGSPETFGGLYACYGGGAVLGGLVTAAMAGVSWRRLFVGAGVFAGATLVLAPVRSVVLAAILLIVIGAAWTTWSSQAQAILQLAAPDRLRGRTISFYNSSLLAGVPFGGLAWGSLAAFGGTTLPLAVSGVAGIIAAGFCAVYLRRRPKLVQLPEPNLAPDSTALL